MAKYLIIEKYCNTVYVYIEKDKHHKEMSKHRNLANRLSETHLGTECDLNAYSNGHYFVFELKEKKSDKVKTIKKPKNKSGKKHAAHKIKRKQAR